MARHGIRAEKGIRYAGLNDKIVMRKLFFVWEICDHPLQSAVARGCKDMEIDGIAWGKKSTCEQALDPVQNGRR